MSQLSAPAEAARRADLFNRLNTSKLTGRHIGLYAILMVGHMFDGFGISMIGYVLAGVAGTFALKPAAVGFLPSAGFFGMVVGALVIGPLTDRIGRKRGLLLAIATYALFSFLSAVAPSFGALLWFRALQGVGLGMEIPCLITYVSEFMPTRYRGPMITFSTFFWSGATVLGGVLAAALIPHYGWRILFVVGAIPAVMLLIVWAFVPESVRYQVKEGHLASAERFVGWLCKPQQAASRPAVAPPLEESKRVAIGRIFSGRYARLTSGVWLMEFISGVVLFGLVAWLPSLFLRMGFGLVHSFLFSAAITGSGAIGSVVGGLIIERIGYRTTMISGFLLGGIFLLLWVTANTPTSIVLIGALAALFGIGAGGVVYAYMGSLYPTAVRATGTAWGGVWNRAGGIIAPPVLGFMIGLHLPTYGFFVVLGALWVIGAIVALAMTHELKGKSLEQIDHELAH